MKENDLLVKENEKLKARRSASTSKPKPERPNQWWGIDMTKVITEEGWAYVVIVNDWFTKKILGTFTGSRSQAADWLAALDEAVCRQFPGGIKDTMVEELNLMSERRESADFFEIYAGSGKFRHPTSVHRIRESERQC
jgi:transposase InsO family protein